MIRYQVWYGNDGYTSDDIYDSRDEALAAIASHMGWDTAKMAESDSYTCTIDSDKTSERVSVYEDMGACERDEGGPHAPTITEVLP